MKYDGLVTNGEADVKDEVFMEYLRLGGLTPPKSFKSSSKKNMKTRSIEANSPRHQNDSLGRLPPINQMSHQKQDRYQPMQALTPIKPHYHDNVSKSNDDYVAAYN